MPKIDRDGVKIYYEVHGSGPDAVADPRLFVDLGDVAGPDRGAVETSQTCVVGHARPRPVRLSRGSRSLQRSADGCGHGGVARRGRRRQRHRRRTFARGLYVAGLLSCASRARPRASDHRYRAGIQEGRGPRSLEHARPRHRRPLRARRPCGSEIGQPRALEREPSRCHGPGARRARHADPARRPRDRSVARHQGAVAGGGRRR